MSVTVNLGSSSLEITPNPAINNSPELIAKRHIVGIFPLKYQQKQPTDDEWTYRYNTITVIRLYVRSLKKIRMVDLELQDISNQSGWSGGTLADQQQAMQDINLWLVSGIIPPPPPYVIATDASMMITSISGLNYVSGNGPSPSSATFKIQAAGLSPSAGNITVTPPTSFEVFNGSTWVSTPFTIPYTGGAIITGQIYMVRLKSGFTPGPFSETLIISAPSAPNYNISVNGSVTYSIEAENYFAELSPQPSTTYKNAIQALINTLISNGIWSNLDRLWIHATEHQQNARVSLVNPSSTKLTEVNSPVWNAMQGYNGDGLTMHINSNFIASVHGVNYTQNSACAFSYSRSNVTENSYDIGVNDGPTKTYLIPRWSDTNFYYPVNQTTANSNPAIGVANTLAMNSITRTSSVLSAAHKRGVQQSTSAFPSSTLPTIPFYILGGNIMGSLFAASTRQIAITGFGSGTINQLTLYNSLQTFATTLAFQV